METLYKFRVYRERLNSGGYTDRGRYFGAGGEPLYYYVGEVEYRPTDRPPSTETTEGWARAADRTEIKAYLRALYPQAKFYR